MRVTTNVERNPKANTLPSKNLLSCIASVNRAIWSMFFDFREVAQSYIEHVSIKILMRNDGETPHSVIVEIKLKGNENFQFERKFSNSFDANIDYDTEYRNLGNKIRRDMKGYVDIAFSDVICIFKSRTDELLEEKIEPQV